MSRILWFVSVLVLAVSLDAVALRAQAFQGSGQEATELFALSAGLVVFELEHRGEGAFGVRLLDEQGRVVEEMVQATGNFRGSKAVRVPQDGRYLLDVAATGPWSVRRRDAGADAAPAAATSAAASAAAPPSTASPLFTSGWEAGRLAAGQVSTNSWLARGLVGGMVAGPIGAGLVVGLAGRSGVGELGAGADGGADAQYRQGYEDGFAARLREQRKKKAFIGGMIGSGVFLAGLVYMIDVAQGGKGGASNSPPGDGGQFGRVPR